MKFENMKSALKRLFSKTKSSYNAQADRQWRIKEEEEAYFAKNKYKEKQYGKYSQNNKKLNSLNKIGKVSLWLICDSKMYWTDQCPHKYDSAASLVTENETEKDQENCEKVNIVFMTEDIAKSEVFGAEASKSAVIDTACTKTVAGQIWFENFKSNLTEQTLKNTETFL